MAKTQAQTTLWVAVIGAAGAILGNSLPPVMQRIIQPQPQSVRLQGAVMKSDVKPGRRHPLKDVSVEYDLGGKPIFAKTDQNGLFTIEVGSPAKIGDLLTLKLRRTCYQDFDETIAVANVLLTLYLWANPSRTCDDPTIVSISVSSRFVEKTFPVVHHGTVPCKNSPCSPDGKWEATDVSEALTAGPNDIFLKGSVVCVAGPCPFTQIVQDGFSSGGQGIHVVVRNWSDTATYILKGEIAGPVPLPVEIKGDSFTYRTYRSKGEGGHQELIAETSEGEHLVLPSVNADGRFIGLPQASWASCHESVDEYPTLHTQWTFHCKLKEGYKFSSGLLQKKTFR